MDKNHIIDKLGGSSEVARLCEVTVGAVSQWRKEGIPKARLMFLKLACPDAFLTDGSIHKPRESQMHDPKDTDKTPIGPTDVITKGGAHV